jgi:uncharacterized membrane protein
MTMSFTATADRSSRWLLIVSLSLNLFFVGTVGAMAIRHHFAPPRPQAMERPRTAAARFERVAVTLPAADAARLWAEFRARETAAEGTRDALNRAYEGVQAALRAQPFDADKLRAAMSEARSARTVHEQTIQEIIAAGASGMSQDGRNKLADWPPRQPSAKH